MFFLRGLYNKSLKDWSRGKQLILFPPNLNVSLGRLSGHKINFFSRDQSPVYRLFIASRKHDHITPIRRRLHWLPVRYRIIFLKLEQNYKALNIQAPSYIKDLLKYKNSGRVLRFSNKHSHDEPIAKLKTYGDRAYSVAAPKLWNKLPLDIRLSSAVTIFKTNLKTCLFTNSIDL